MKTTSCLLAGCILAFSGYSQTVGTKASFIPADWTLFYEATGDLNKDSLSDVALIIENSIADADGEKQRALIVLFKNNKKDNTYLQVCRADDVVLGSESGGMLGDPFSLMEIKKNILRIDFFGGSSTKWTTTHRYRYQEGYFRVIGATYRIDGSEGTEIFDYNLSNGKIIVTKKGAAGKTVTTNLVNKISPISMDDFSPDAVWAILMPNDYAKVSTCVLEDVGLGDCAHIIFDCGDFGNAKTYLDDASVTLWYDLMEESEAGEIYVNPKYKGRQFEITYAEDTGIRCEPEGSTTYQLVVGFRLKN